MRSSDRGPASTSDFSQQLTGTNCCVECSECSPPSRNRRHSSKNNRNGRTLPTPASFDRLQDPMTGVDNGDDKANKLFFLGSNCPTVKVHFPRDLQHAPATPMEPKNGTQSFGPTLAKLRSAAPEPRSAGAKEAEWVPLPGSDVRLCRQFPTGSRITSVDGARDGHADGGGRGIQHDGLQFSGFVYFLVRFWHFVT